MRISIVPLVILCIGALIGSLRGQQDVRRKVAKAAQQPVIAKVYSLRDLPVWTEKGAKFDPSILVALIGSRITPEKLGKEYSFFPQPNNASLVVSTTREAHEAIADMLAELRNQ